MDQEQLIQDDMEINIRYLMSTPMLKKENLKKVNDDIWETLIFIKNVHFNVRFTKKKT